MPFKDPEKKRAYHQMYYETHAADWRPRSKKYKKTHRAKVLVARRKRYQERKEELQAKAVARYWLDPEARRAESRAYAIAHPEETRAKSRQRRAAKANAAINDLSKDQWKEIVAAWKSCCAYCGRKMKRLTQDHITA